MTGAENPRLLFPLGLLVATPGALEAVGDGDIGQALARHMHGDWGELGEKDKRENELALEQGYRLLSSYRSATGVKFWIITEADRSATTVLLPEEY